MKIVQPIVKSNDCRCPVTDFLFYYDEFGVTGMECPKHGMLNEIDSIEFNSLKDWERWKNERSSH